MPKPLAARTEWIRSDGDDALVRVHVQTRASRPGVGAVDPWRAALLVRVRAAPEGGRANEEVAEVLADVLEVPPDAIEIIRGAKSRDKEVRVRGSSGAQARR